MFHLWQKLSDNTSLCPCLVRKKNHHVCKKQTKNLVMQHTWHKGGWPPYSAKTYNGILGKERNRSMKLATMLIYWAFCVGSYSCAWHEIVKQNIELNWKKLLMSPCGYRASHCTKCSDQGCMTKGFQKASVFVERNFVGTYQKMSSYLI